MNGCVIVAKRIIIVTNALRNNFTRVFHLFMVSQGERSHLYMHRCFTTQTRVNIGKILRFPGFYFSVALSCFIVTFQYTNKLHTFNICGQLCVRKHKTNCQETIKPEPNCILHKKTEYRETKPIFKKKQQKKSIFTDLRLNRVKLFRIPQQLRVPPDLSNIIHTFRQKK